MFLFCSYLFFLINLLLYISSDYGGYNMNEYINNLLNGLEDKDSKVEKLKNELFKLELELNRLKSYTPTTTDLMFSFGDDNEDIEKNVNEQEEIAKKIRAINLELRNYIN